MSGSPVKQAALALGLEVAHDLDALLLREVELGVVAAYGAIIPSALLARVPMINIHFSLLPRWRGAAPVERAILAGDETTGVEIMGVEAGLDTGPIYAESQTPIGQKSAEELTAELAMRGAALLVETLARPDGLTAPRAQVGEPVYAHKLTPADFAVHADDSANVVLRRVRLGRAYVLVNDKRLRLLAATPATDLVETGRVEMCGERVVLGTVSGSIELLEVQPEGSRRMSATAWWRGRREPGALVWHSGIEA
jgi:methionyl-tRNA formyltransferase